MKVGDLFFIRWVDSTGCQMGWTMTEDIRGAKLAKIESVGFVMAKTKKAVQITPHINVSDGGSVMGVITIPKSAIIFSLMLSVPKRKRQRA